MHKVRGAGSQNKENQEHHLVDNAVILNWIFEKQNVTILTGCYGFREVTKQLMGVR